MTTKEFLGDLGVIDEDVFVPQNDKYSHISELMEEYAEYRMSLLKGDIKYQISRIPDRPELNQNYTSIDQGFLLCFRHVKKMIERME